MSYLLRARGETHSLNSTVTPCDILSDEQNDAMRRMAISRDSLNLPGSNLLRIIAASASNCIFTRFATLLGT